MTQKLRSLNREKDIPATDVRKRALDIPVDGSAFEIGLEDHDKSILYYIENKIRPFVVQNGSRIDVPVKMSNREVWDAIQNGSTYRDANGKLLIPLISINRESVEVKQDGPMKVDANNPHHYRVFEKRYSQTNPYLDSGRLNGSLPQKEYIIVPIPEYITITYSGVALTNYMSQMNHLVEAFLYARQTYWGDGRLNFLTKIDGFQNATEVSVDEERFIKNEFELTVNGYLVPKVPQAEMNIKKLFSPTTIKVTFNANKIINPTD